MGWVKICNNLFLWSSILIINCHCVFHSIAMEKPAKAKKAKVPKVVHVAQDNLPDKQANSPAPQPEENKPVKKLKHWPEHPLLSYNAFFGRKK